MSDEEALGQYLLVTKLPLEDDDSTYLSRDRPIKVGEFSDDDI